MNGVVKNKLTNGLVFIAGEDGNEYVVSQTTVDKKLKLGRRISFDRSDRPYKEGHCPWAENVKLLEFYQTPDGDAEWLVLPEKMRRIEQKIEWCRCGCCGEVSTKASKYCANCGTKMIRTEEIKQIAKNVYQPLRQEGGEWDA